MTAALGGKTREELAELFEYSIVTGRVYRKVKRSQQPEGIQVGTVDGKGYLHVAMNRRFILLHRLAVFLLTGELPKQVDHHDHSRRNNAWHNLRPCTAKGNAGNASLSRKNTSGLKGVSMNTRSGKWHAQIKINGKQTYLGRRDCPIEAARLYNAAAIEHFGEFANVNRV